jgi:hypothetical protein
LLGKDYEIMKAKIALFFDVAIRNPVECYLCTENIWQPHPLSPSPPGERV